MISSQESKGKPTGRRGELEQCLAILKVCKQPTKKTNIMGKANINFSIVNQHLEKLIKYDLIFAKQSRYTLYKTSELGEYFLDRFVIFENFIENKPNLGLMCESEQGTPTRQVRMLGEN